MSIIVTIISNITVLQCYLLWIFVSIRRLLQLIVCIVVPAPPHLKNMTPSFAKSPFKSANYPRPLFRRFTTPPLPPLPPKFDFSKNSHNIKLPSSHLLKVTKFLVEISQFKFLVITEKSIEFLFIIFFAIKYFRF